MKNISSFMNKLIAILLLVSISSQNIVFARDSQQEDKTRIDYSDTTGKVSFIGADPSNPITIRSAQAADLRPEGSALAMIAQYASDFGLKNPSSELNLILADQVDGRNVTRFQQVYNGVPIMGGEMIVNATDQAKLLSLSGEISPDLSLDTQPSISPKQALLTALELTAKHYQLSTDELEGSTPELWIYDSRLFEPDGMQPSLVWRLEVKSTDASLPINELVLVDAKRGSVTLNFNQIDTAWNLEDEPPTEVPTVTPIPATPVPDLTVEPIPSTPKQTSDEEDPRSQQESLGVNYYVDIVNGNDANSCTSTDSPCQHIQQTVDKAAAGDIIYVAEGVYTNTGSNVVFINKGITLSGGWNSAFSSQNGFSTIDGENARKGILINSSGSTIVVNNFVIQNGFSSQGGGISNTNANLTINNTTIKNNSSSLSGGGIYSGGALSLNNSTISSNTARTLLLGDYGGGGIYQAAGSLTIQNSTIAHNKVAGSSGTGIRGGGIYDNTTGIITLRNSILSNNIAYSSSPDCAGSINISDHNIIGNTTGCAFSSSTNDQINIDPQIASLILGNFLPPTSGSPAINAGDAATCTVYDQRGLLRLSDGFCDIGAYEYTVPGPAASLIISSGNNQIAQISHAFSTPLTVYVVDAAGSPVSGENVTFTAPNSGPSGIFSASSTRITTVATGSSGFASTSIFNANNTTGSYIVTAAVSGIILPVQFQLENQVPIPNTVTVFSGSSQSAYLNIDFTNPISVLVKDQFGNAIQGVTVTFTAPSTGASSVFNNTGNNTTTAVTNISGIATTSAFAANGVTGTYSISASADGIVTPATFQLTNTTVVCSITNQTNSDSIFFKPYKKFLCGPTSSLSYGVGSGDFNNDDLQDIALSLKKGTSTQHMLLIFLQNVNGSYSANPVSYAAGNRSEYLAVGDVNNDGLQDVVTADFSDNTISVFIQLANGTFAKRVTYATGNGPDSIAIGDINNDSLKDVVVSHWNSPTIGVFIQNSNGTLNALLNYPAIAAGYDDIAIGDINNDGLNDVVKMNGQGNNANALLVYTQNQSHTLNSYVTHTCSSPCIGNGIEVGDVTGDGKADIVMAYGGNGSSAKIAVFAQDGNGVLQPSTLYSSYDIPDAVEIADIDSDNLLDVIVLHSGWQKAGMYLQQSNGMLGIESLYSIPYKSWYYSQDIVVSDVNNDNLPDILIADISGLVILYHSPTPAQGSFIHTYSANNTTTLPGGFLCDDTMIGCTQGINLDADAAQQYAMGVYQFYNSKHGRNSIDNQGMTIISSVNYSSNFQNAFWNGSQMVYGTGYPAADDVVGHELTHGVTDYESNLFYYYQSGAINESFSDIWGELFDQENGSGTDTAGVKWLMGENLPGGAIRSMSNPPAYGDPDKMTSTLYYTGSGDDGGVHTNSGVNNKAASLLVDGGSFNGKTVTAIGANKTLAIYYEVQTNLLTSGADYADLYNALYQGCLNLVGGPLGITSGDCQQVRNAADAVQMNLQPVANFNPEAPLCSNASFPYVAPVFFEDFESGTSNWTFDNGASTRWQYDSPYGAFAHSGTHFIYADDYPQVSGSPTDAKARLTVQNIPANAFLHFAHAYEFESAAPYYYDGGVLEYSINNGATWVDAGSLINANGYKGTIYPNWNNPLKGRSAFVGTSHGYISTRLNLSSLAGKSVTFRWRMGLDDSVSFWGWWLDDVQIYTCSDGFTISGNTGVDGSTLSYVDGTPKTATADANGNYSLKVSSNWSGVITPTHACYTFNPASSTYNNVTSNQTGQNYTPTLISGSGCADINVTTAGTPTGIHTLAPATSQVLKYAVDGGPVVIGSGNGTNVIASLNQWRRRPTTTVGWTGVSQSMALPVSLITNQYFFPRYDDSAPNSLYNALLLANVDTVSRDITVTIAGTVRGTYTLAPSASQFVSYPGVAGGPVVVSSDTGAKIVASLYELIRDPSLPGWNGQSEMMGLPFSQLSDSYLIPIYFGAANPNTLNASLYIANVDTTDTIIEIKIAGVSRGTYNLAPNTGQVVKYAVDGGPVEISSNNGAKIIASLNQWRRRPTTKVGWTGVSQSMALPVGLITNQYVIPRYDDSEPNSLYNALLLANVDTVSRDITVTIAGTVRGTYTLAPSASQFVSYPGLVGGPVVVSSDTGAKIVASLYELIRDPSAAGWNGQSEMMGLPGTQLSDQYLIPLYFGGANPNTLNASMYIAVP